MAKENEAMTSNNDKKRFYWIKLDKGFFKRHDIKIVESMENGKDYILFYLKLLCEATSHNGELRFSESVPYNENMLATVTNTNVDIVRSAIKVFEKLGMMEILSDGTIYLEQCAKMLDYDTQGAIRKREYREKVNNQKELSCCPQVSPKSPREIELEKDIELDTELELEKEKIKLDRTREKQQSVAEKLVAKLVNSDYVSIDDIEYPDYVETMSQLLKDYEPLDVKVKLGYFIQQVCSYMPTGKFDKSGKEIFRYKLRDDQVIEDRFNYFRTTMLSNLTKEIR